MHAVDLIAAASLCVSFVALLVAWYAAFKANRNSSAATLVALSEAFRQAWNRFLAAKDDDGRYNELCDLMNLIEIGCGIRVEGSMSGMSRNMMTIYLNDVLGLLIQNEFTKSKVATMIHSRTTFENVRKFLKMQPKYLSVTIPPDWYQSTQ